MTEEGYGRESPRRGWHVPWWIFLLLLSAFVVAAWFMWSRTPEKASLHGVLVDLELEPADSPRYTELRTALTTRLAAEEDVLRGKVISLDTVHFSQFTRQYLASRNVDFIVLSPQGTPWHRYAGPRGAQLEAIKNLLRELVLQHDLPVLGICGGHQFMTLAFGGAVGFIDPRFEGAVLDRYPAEAISERGLTRLETIQDDPIFAGVAVHPGGFEVMESHYEEVKRVPAPFVNLASSELSEFQLIRFPGKTVYGMAFHPERGWDSINGGQQPVTSGRRMLANFLFMVSRHKGSAYAGTPSSTSR